MPTTLSDMVVVNRARVCAAGSVAIWASALGCASPPPQPRSADLIMPSWASENEQRTASKPKETTRLVQKSDLVYGDPAKERGTPGRAPKSPFLPKSVNSRFFGGSGCIETSTNKCR